jgi:hypothetical protein
MKRATFVLVFAATMILGLQTQGATEDTPQSDAELLQLERTKWSSSGPLAGC